jgi:hypothetical protein
MVVGLFGLDWVWGGHVREWGFGGCGGEEEGGEEEGEEGSLSLSLLLDCL